MAVEEKQELGLEGTKKAYPSDVPQLHGIKLLAPQDIHSHLNHLPLPNLHTGLQAQKPHTQLKQSLKKHTLLFHLFRQKTWIEG